MFSPSRPHTPASSIGTLSRRWSGISRYSYTTNITTPPQTRPGSAIGGGKLVSWDAELDEDFLSRFGPLRKDLFRTHTPPTRDIRLLPDEDDDEEGHLAWAIPLQKDIWPIRYPVIIAGPEVLYADSFGAGPQLLPLTRGVVLDGIDEIVEELAEIRRVSREIVDTENRLLDVRDGGWPAFEARQRGVLRRLKDRMRTVKQRVVVKVQERSRKHEEKGHKLGGEPKARVLVV